MEKQERLQIRITLTNNKGWKETTSVDYDRYKDNKDLVDNIIEKLLEHNSDMQKAKELSNKSLEWRP
jgi:hypothetical protein